MFSGFRANQRGECRKKAGFVAQRQSLFGFSGTASDLGLKSGKKRRSNVCSVKHFLLYIDLSARCFLFCLRHFWWLKWTSYINLYKFLTDLDTDISCLNAETNIKNTLTNFFQKRLIYNLTFKTNYTNNKVIGASGSIAFKSEFISVIRFFKQFSISSTILNIAEELINLTPTELQVNFELGKRQQLAHSWCGISYTC